MPVTPWHAKLDGSGWQRGDRQLPLSPPIITLHWEWWWIAPTDRLRTAPDWPNGGSRSYRLGRSTSGGSYGTAPVPAVADDAKTSESGQEQRQGRRKRYDFGLKLVAISQKPFTGIHVPSYSKK